jgi:hypothetical protein
MTPTNDAPPLPLRCAPGRKGLFPCVAVGAVVGAIRPFLLGWIAFVLRDHKPILEKQRVCVVPGIRYAGAAAACCLSLPTVSKRREI